MAERRDTEAEERGTSGLSIREEFLLLQQGRRLSSRRNVQSVAEKQRQEQLNQMNYQKPRKKEVKRGKRKSIGGVGIAGQSGLSKRGVNIDNEDSYRSGKSQSDTYGDDSSKNTKQRRESKQQEKRQVATERVSGQSLKQSSTSRKKGRQGASHYVGRGRPPRDPNTSRVGGGVGKKFGVSLKTDEMQQRASRSSRKGVNKLQQNASQTSVRVAQIEDSDDDAYGEENYGLDEESYPEDDEDSISATETPVPSDREKPPHQLSKPKSLNRRYKQTGRKRVSTSYGSIQIEQEEDQRQRAALNDEDMMRRQQDNESEEEDTEHGVKRRVKHSHRSTDKDDFQSPNKKQNLILKRKNIFSSNQKSQKSQEKDFWKAYDDLKMLDKVIPDLDKVQGCYVQLSEQLFGTIAKVEKSDDQSYRIFTKSLNAEQDSNQSYTLQQVKFLARAYLCKISDLVVDKLPQDFLQSIKIPSDVNMQDVNDPEQASEKDGLVVLLQVISQNNTEEIVGSENNFERRNESVYVQGGSSIHRLHALLATSNDQFALFPVVFQSNSGRNKKPNKWLLPEHPVTDEKTVEFDNDRDDVYDSEARQMCFKDIQVAKQSLKIARQIQASFKENYLQKVERVRVTSENIYDCLFTLVQLNGKMDDQRSAEVQEEEEEKKTELQIGLLTNYTKCSVSQNKENTGIKNLAFIVLLKSPEPIHEDNVAWVDIDEVEVYANQSLGFVSQQWLQSHCATDSQNPIRLRQLGMLNKQESLQEKLKTINLNLKIEDEDAQDNHERRQGQLRSDFLNSNCKKCFYSACLEEDQSVKCIQCSACQNKYHEKCMSPFQVYKAKDEKEWLCFNCIRCTNCKSNQDQDSFLVCQDCNTPYHYQCLPQSYKSRLRPLFTAVVEDGQTVGQRLNLRVDKFKCEDCMACQNCKSGKAGEQASNKWSKDFKFCSPCNKKREKKMFCPICERFWPSYINSKSIKTGQICEESTHLPPQFEQMIKCQGCSMLVHLDCDLILSQSDTKRQILGDEKSYTEQAVILKTYGGLKYKCPNCRKQIRIGLLDQILDTLIAEDKQKHFLEPFWKDMQQYREYKEQIKKPICFTMIKSELRNSKRYIVKPQEFKNDIERIFVNAKTFNANPEIYKDAVKIHDKTNQIFNNPRLSETIEAFKKSTINEFLHNYQKRIFWHNQLQGVDQEIEVPELTSMKPSEVLLSLEKHDIRMYGIKTLAAIGEGLLELSAQASYEVDFGGKNSTAFGNPLNFSLQTRLPQKEQWKNLTEDLRLNDDRDTCWYPNPIKVSFDDPSLIFEEMCYLCGAFGNKEDFLCCNLCCESFHPYCLPYPKENRDQFQNYWRCYNCIFCEKCHSSKQWDGLLICAVCDKVDHFWCLEPQLIDVPEGNWKCPDCFKCLKCGTKQFFSEEDIAKKVNLDPNEKFVNSCDFELCYQCGQDEDKKSMCSICNSTTGFGMNLSRINQTSDQKEKQALLQQNLLQSQSDEANNCVQKCNKCLKYSHLACSKTSYPDLVRLSKVINLSIKHESGEMGTETPKSIYQCFECLLIDKLPSFYLYQENEIFQGLHQSVQRQQMLFDLCKDILVPMLPDPKSDQQQQMYIGNFIIQNQKFFRDDRLINQWLAVLDSSVDPSAANQSQHGETTTLEITNQVEQKDEIELIDLDMKKEDVEMEQKEDNAVIIPTEIEGSAEQKEVNSEMKGCNDIFKFSSNDGKHYASVFDAYQTVSVFECHIDGKKINEQTTCVPCQNDISTGVSREDSSDVNNVNKQVWTDLFGHKTTFLPTKRDTYSNIHQVQNNRHGKQSYFEDLDQLKDRINVPTWEKLEAIDFNEIFTKIEFRAVIKIKLLFMQWVQQLADNTVNMVLGSQKQNSLKRQELQRKESLKELKDSDVIMIDTTAPSKNAIRNTPNKFRNPEMLTVPSICTEDDDMIDNPQKKIKCILCGLKGERVISGRLIPYQMNQFVHVNCAFWTQEVQEGQEERDVCSELYNFQFAYNAFRNNACFYCGQKGATIFCSNWRAKKCPAVFHFPCAYASRKVAFMQNTDVYCEVCAMKKEDATPGFPIKLRDYTKRRIIIVKNIQPQYTRVFNKQLKKLQSTEYEDEIFGSKSATKMIVGNMHETSSQNQYEHEDGAADENENDGGVFIQTDKWRPYYYDLFNRVGNLTVLSLNRKRNTLIEKLHTQKNSNIAWRDRNKLKFSEQDFTDYSALRIYWKYADRSDGDEQNHDVQMEQQENRVDLGPPANKGYYLFTNKQVQEVLKNQFEKIERFMSKRISEYQIPLIQKMKAQIMVPTNHFDAMIQRKRWQSAEEFWEQQINNLAIRYPKFCQENTCLTVQIIQGLEKYPIQYWNNPGEKIGLELSDFNVVSFFYRSAYKLIQTQKLESSFSLVDADLPPKDPSQDDPDQDRNDSSNHESGFVNNGQKNNPSGMENKQEEKGGKQFTSQKSHTSMLQGEKAGCEQTGITVQQSDKKNKSLESIFHQMLKANLLSQDQNPGNLMNLISPPETSPKSEDLEDDRNYQHRRDLSTRNMNYEQIMKCLGRKTMAMRKAERQKTQEMQAQKDAAELFFNPTHQQHYHGSGFIPRLAQAPDGMIDVDGDPSKKDGSLTANQEESRDAKDKTQTQKEQNDTTDLTKKGQDYNAAMRYRAAKERPKETLVWISKIHRNGLFAGQPMNPKDIVIEYVGEKIRGAVADKREILYEKLGVGDCYLFRLDKDYIIDATFFGSKARYINHSCDPNLISEYLTVNGEPHIILYASRYIEAGEELTFDYNFAPDLEMIECFCGTVKCRGRLT